MSCTARVAKLIDRAFVRELSARQRERLRSHLAECLECRQRWEQLAIVDRRLAGPRLNEQTIADIGRAVTSATRVPGRRLVWATAATAAVASLVLVLLLVRPGPSGSTLTPRGTHSQGRTPGVRAFCVAGDADHVRAEVRMVSTGHVPVLRCTIDDDLQLAYTSPDREGLTMVAFARLDSSIVRYAPTDDAITASVRPDRIDELIPWSTHLAAEHRPGRYDVVVRFFDRQVATGEAIDGRTIPLVELHATLEVVRGDVLDAE